MKEIEKKWETSKSYCEVNSDDDGQLHFEGCYYLDGIAFPFSVREQKSGNHILRGQVSVFSQSQGRLMRARAKKENGDPKMIQKTIMKRLGEGYEIANVIAFLASDLSSYVTGQVIRVDGGM